MAEPALLPPDHSTATEAARIDLMGATALGVGGMMGAGLYTLLGLAARSSGVLLPLAFLMAGIAASFSVYSYARLGTAFPGRGAAPTSWRRPWATPSSAPRSMSSSTAPI